ncbi:MAG: PEP-CTERM sorting domain-containing protein [Verrucomicrobiae bacterium]|nr:PEP-CTERM sorting domain-containing protein [Verrucomicrobiae bacterium]
MNPKPLRPNLNRLTIAACTALLALSSISRADTSFTLINTTADAFLANGPSGNLAANNYGGAGTLAIAPASSAKGEFDSVIKFNTSAAISQFNSTYGAGNWTLTGLTLMLASNTGTQGANPGNAVFNTIHSGNFGIDWIANDSWVEGTGNPGTPQPTGVNFNSIPSLIATYDSLGTYTYTPPGNNVYASYSLTLDGGLVADAAAGGDVSLYFYAADSQISYLFNSRTFSQANPELILTAAPVPEPTTMALLALALGGGWYLRKGKIQS